MKLDEHVVSILKEKKVAIVYIFGSTVLGTARETSDVDIGIVFLEPICLDGNKRLTLLTYFNDIFSEVFPDREIDIMFLDLAPLTLRFEVVTTGKVLYSISEDFVFNYKERIIKEYIDFKYFLDEQDKTFLARYETTDK